MKIHHLKGCLLSKSNTFDQNFMKLGHIVLYHDVFFKLDNGPYRTMFFSSYGPLFMKIHHLKQMSALEVEYF